MNTSKLRIGVEETKTARPCCRGLIIVYSERPLDTQQNKWLKFLLFCKACTMENNNKNPNASDMRWLDLEFL